jgi:hypothetical protein
MLTSPYLLQFDVLGNRKTEAFREIGPLPNRVSRELPPDGLPELDRYLVCALQPAQRRRKRGRAALQGLFVRIRSSTVSTRQQRAFSGVCLR